VHPRDADTTDSDHERLSLHAGGKKAAVRDIHRTYESEDLEQSDTDVDSDEFEAERIEYMSTLAKRKLDIAQQENERRKVVFVDLSFDSSFAYTSNSADDSSYKTDYTTTLMHMVKQLESVLGKSSTTMQWAKS
jgi:hypothetical protein